MNSLNTSAHVAIDLPDVSAQPSATSRDTDAPSESDTDSDIQPPESRSRLSPRLKLILSFALIIISLVCISCTVLNWSRYEARVRDYEWKEHSCTRREKRKAKDPSFNPNLYRIEVIVTGLSSRQSTRVTAFDGRTSDYTLTKSQADARLSDIDLKDNVCWVRRADESQVSISKVEGDAEDVSQGRRALYIAWTTTFLAAVASMTTLVLSSHWIGELGSRRESDDEDDKGRGMLSREQARYVCQRFGTQAKVKEAGWACSVCLEGEVEGGTGVVHLPCEHQFHVQCIKKWLRRGKSACPLCKWDARTLFDGDGKPSAEGVGAETATEMDIEGREVSDDAT